MNATEQFLNFIQYKGGQITLGEIMQTHFACEYRRMFTEMRQQGHRVKVILNRKQPSLNTYYLDDKIPVEQPPMKFEGNQAVMF